ncbi:MAG: hypothetical protein JXL80_01070 [Planctomycetes bacterium]|nr:hypothetical protein [Planctomycetota bacterium]
MDMSEAAVKSGQTNPTEVIKLLKRGVSIHSVENLHAKVFAVGRRAFIGSTNASNRSKDVLVEASVATNDASAVSACREFVGSLTGEPVTLHHARNMERIYRPPHIKGRRQRVRGRRGEATPTHSRLWVLSLVVRSWDAQAEEEKSKGLPTAESRLRSTSRYKVDDFHWSGGSFLNRAKRNDLVIQVVEENKRRVMVRPPARVIYVKRYMKGRSNQAIAFLEMPKRLRSKKLALVRRRLGPASEFMKKRRVERVVRNVSLAHDILNLWRH